MSRTPNSPNPLGPGGRLPPRPVPPAGGSPAQPVAPRAPAGTGVVPPGTVRIPPRAPLTTPARPAPITPPAATRPPAAAPVAPESRNATPAPQPASPQEEIPQPVETPDQAREEVAVNPSPAPNQPVFRPLGVDEEIVARGSGDYRIRRYLMVVLLVGMGGWFGYDGFKGWPRENEKINKLSEERKQANLDGNKDLVKSIDQDSLAGKPPHTGTDLFIQKMLAFLLPGIGAATLSWALYNSRGAYRLKGTTLSVPGHLEVPITSITAIDRSQWDRKGIAYIEYVTTDGESAAFDLDDFIYQREETDRIFDIIAAAVGGDEESAEEATA